MGGSGDIVEKAPSDRERLESDIRGACERGEHDRAVELALEAYGAEILGYLCARVGDEPTAREVYSDFSVDLWRGLERFEWRCSARAWAYTLARNTAADHHRRVARRRRHEAPMCDVDQVPWRPATRTPTYARTPMRNRVAQLREQLEPEDRELLSLRIDRRMTFPELAVVMSGGALTDEVDIKRDATRLRQRFAVAKRRLRQLARREGLTK